MGLTHSSEISMESFVLVASRDIQLRCLLVSGTIKSPEWTTASFLLPDAASLAPLVVDFILLHTQLNFLRCSPTGGISPSSILYAIGPEISIGF